MLTPAAVTTLEAPAASPVAGRVTTHRRAVQADRPISHRGVPAARRTSRRVAAAVREQVAEVPALQEVTPRPKSKFPAVVRFVSTTRTSLTLP